MLKSQILIAIVLTCACGFAQSEKVKTYAFINQLSKGSYEGLILTQAFRVFNDEGFQIDQEMSLDSTRVDEKRNSFIATLFFHRPGDGFSLSHEIILKGKYIDPSLGMSDKILQSIEIVNLGTN